MTIEFTNADQSIPVKHSEFGIAAFIISLLNSGCLIISIGLPAIFTIRKISINNGIALLLGISFFAVFLFSLAGLMIGIIGLFQHKRKKVFSIIGFILNLISLIIVGAFIVPGLVRSLT